MSEYLGVALHHETGRLMYINQASELSSEATDGKELRFNPMRPFDVKFPKTDDSYIVQRLPLTAIIPERQINGFSTGRQEEYSVSQGFYSTDSAPLSPTIAMWASIKCKKLVNYEFIYAGPDLDIVFPMSKFLGMDKKLGGSQDTLVSLTQTASSLKFLRKSNVTEWQSIQEKSVSLSVLLIYFAC